MQAITMSTLLIIWDSDVVRTQACPPRHYNATRGKPLSFATSSERNHMNPNGLSTARLAHMHDVLARYVDRGDVPGVVMLLNWNGETHVDAIGTTAFGVSDPLRRDAIFRISSMTKPITAVATLLLVEDGTLRLDDPVDVLLPELADRTVLRRLDGPINDTLPAKRPITVRDLLTFRMGFGQMMEAPASYPIVQAASEQQLGMGPPSPATMPDPAEWMRRLGALPLMHQPGETWMYNTAADVLGVLIARAAGQPLETLMRERIFTPLGMDDTGFHVPATALNRFVPSYWAAGEAEALTLYDAADNTSQWSSPPAFPSGAGGLVSTIDDYSAFGYMLLHKGHYGSTRLLSEASVALMTTNQLTPQQRAGAGDFLGATRGWGFGVSIVMEPDAVVAVPGRFGWEGGLGTSWASDPKQNLVAILMTQVMGFPSGIYDDFWRTVYQIIAR
jgi:CubicO group peptidase (beta-lactamase class C family)